MASMTQIGRYEVKRRTGSHGTAALYEAFDPVMKRPVTIRITEGEADSGASEEPGLSFDPRQMAGLDHPNIIRVLACEEDGARPYLVMEQFEGRALTAVLNQQPGLESARVSEILKSAASALDHLHAKGLIHNHLTPESLVLSDEGLLKLAGCEVACAPEQAYADQADREFPLEAIPYMPPEFLRGEKLDKGADQFSLAAVAFHALTGTRPFQASSSIGVLRQVMFEKPVLGKLRDKFSLSVVRVFETALAAVPAARYGSCGEFVSALDAALSVREAAATRLATPAEVAPAPQAAPIPKPAAVSPGKSSRPWLVWVLGFVILAGLAALAAKLFFGGTTTNVVTPAPAPVIAPTPATTTPPPAQTKAPPSVPKSGKAKSVAKGPVKAEDKTAKPAAKSDGTASSEATGAPAGPAANPASAPPTKQAAPKSEEKAPAPPPAEQPAPPKAAPPKLTPGKIN